MSNWEPLKIPNNHMKEINNIIKISKKMIYNRIELDSNFIGNNQVNYNIADGYAGIALACSYFDIIFPDEKWDVLGKKCLEITVNSLEKEKELDIGLFSGLSGIAMSAVFLSRNFTRYNNLIKTFDDLLLTKTVKFSETLNTQKDGISRSSYDIINGMSGVGAYLLYKNKTKRVRYALETILRTFVNLCGDGNKKFYFYIKNDHLSSYEKHTEQILIWC
jgi:hypothetical protein